MDFYEKHVLIMLFACNSILRWSQQSSTLNEILSTVLFPAVDLLCFSWSATSCECGDSSYSRRVKCTALLTAINWWCCCLKTAGGCRSSCERCIMKLNNRWARYNDEEICSHAWCIRCDNQKVCHTGLKQKCYLKLEITTTAIILCK